MTVCTCDSAKYRGIIHRQWCEAHPLYRAPYLPCSRLDDWLKHAKECWPRPKLRLYRRQAPDVLRDLRNRYAAKTAFDRMDELIFRIERGEMLHGFLGSVYGMDIVLVP